MKVAVHELAAFLKQTTKRPRCYWLHGDEPLLLDEAIALLKASLCSKEQALEYEIHYVDLPEFEWPLLIDQAQTLSLFSAARCFELRFIQARPAAVAIQALQRLLACQKDGNDIILIRSAKLDNKLLQQGQFKKLMAQLVEVPIWPLQGAVLQRWLQKRARSLGLKISANALTTLCAKTEGNLAAAAQSLEQLSLLYGDRTVDEEVVLNEVVSSRQVSLFNWVDQVLAGKSSQALLVLNDLQAQGDSTLLLTWALAREVRLLIKIKTQKALQARDIGVWPKRFSLLQRYAKQFELSVLQMILTSCQQMDRVQKGLQTGCVWRQLADVILMIEKNNHSDKIY